VLVGAGAVSREVGEAMAQGVRTRLGTSLGVAVTGIAGPAADGTSKPVGLTYIAVASDGHVASREFKFEGDRASIRRQAAAEALRMLVAEVRALRPA
jgi:PncC family amidohydrolase